MLQHYVYQIYPLLNNAHLYSPGYVSQLLSHLSALAFAREYPNCVLGSLKVPPLQFLQLLYCMWHVVHVHPLVTVDWKGSY